MLGYLLFITWVYPVLLVYKLWKGIVCNLSGAFQGISFSSLMYVTKRNMANAVESMTKHLEQVQSSLAVSITTTRFLAK